MTFLLTPVARFRAFWNESIFFGGFLVAGVVGLPFLITVIALKATGHSL